MKRWVASGVALIAGVCAGTSRAAADNRQAAAAFVSAGPSIVLVEGDDRATGFVVGRDAQSAFIVTAAHAIDQARWEDNAHAPATVGTRINDKLGPGDFITVRVPATGAVVAAQVLGQPDFVNDVLVAKIPLVAGAVKPICLGKTLRENDDVAIATFGVGFLNGPIVANQPFAAMVARHLGSDSTMRSNGAGAADEFEFDIPSDRGFSGAPLFAVADGLLTGIVRRSASVITDSPTPTMLAVGPSALRTAIETALHDANFPIVQTTIDQPTVPDLSTAGKLRLLRFDDLSDASGAVPAAYATHERTLRSVLTSAFGQKQLDVQFIEDPGKRSLPIATPLTRLTDHLCRVGGDTAAGVVAIRRQLRRVANGTRLLISRVSLLDCKANVIDGADVAPVPTRGDGSLSDDQAHDLVGALHNALSNLTGIGQHRLLNFAIDGIPLDDGEFRAFYLTRTDGTRLWVRAGWLSGSAFDRDKVANEIEITQLSGFTKPIASLSTLELEQRISAAGPDGVSIVSPTPGAPTHLRGADRCFMLMRRQNMIDDGVYVYDQRNGVNAL